MLSGHWLSRPSSVSHFPIRTIQSGKRQFTIRRVVAESDIESTREPILWSPRNDTTITSDCIDKQSSRRIRNSSSWTEAELAPARHLLRALLRESTYLPDPHARTYICSVILARFKDYTLDSKSRVVLENRRQSRFRQARKALSSLRRANAGDNEALPKVLHITYGRIWKRRRELLQSVLDADGVIADTSTMESREEARKEARKARIGTDVKSERHDAKDVKSDGKDVAALNHPDTLTLPKLGPRFKALVISQKQSHPRSQPRALAPTIPGQNSWMRPMPKVRVKNLIKRWYGDTLERTLPPIPTREWEELRARAVGSLPFKGPVKRRSTTAEVQDQTDSSFILEKELGLIDTTSPDMVLARVDEEVRGRTLTGRYMQARWAEVFAQCPKLEWDAHDGKWLVEWGSNVLDRDRKLKMNDPEQTIYTFAPHPAPPSPRMAKQDKPAEFVDEDVTDAAAVES